MKSDQRTRLAPEERRHELLALGVAALADHSLEALTIEYLSKRAGVSRGLLFHYFGSKDGFHREIVSMARESMLHVTAPKEDLPPLERLRYTLENLVRFVRDHRGTFFSLVRGAASGSDGVKAVVEEARVVQAERVISVFLELGAIDSLALRIALRGWVAFAEQVLIDSALDTDMPSNEIVMLLENSLKAITAAVAEDIE